jgi:hypothetical protein
MSTRAASSVVIAGILLLGAVAAWRASTSPAHPTARPAPPVSPLAAEQARPEGPGDPPRERPVGGNVTEEPVLDVVARVREALGRSPADLSPLDRVEGLPAEKRFDALLALASPPSPAGLRYECLKRLREGDWTEERIRKAALLFEAEPEVDLRVQILLGVSKSADPAAGALARRALKDREEEVREIALTALAPERDADRRALLEVATSDASARLRGTAALQLGARASDPEVRSTLLSMLLRDAQDETRKLAITALKGEARRGEPAVLDALRRSAAEDPSAEVQAHARALLDALKK